MAYSKRLYQADDPIERDVLSELVNHIEYQELMLFAFSLNISYSQVVGKNDSNKTQTLQILEAWYRKLPEDFRIKHLILEVKVWQEKCYVSRSVWKGLKVYIQPTVFSTCHDATQLLVPRSENQSKETAQYNIPERKEIIEGVNTSSLGEPNLTLKHKSSSPGSNDTGRRSFTCSGETHDDHTPGEAAGSTGSNTKNVTLVKTSRPKKVKKLENKDKKVKEQNEKKEMKTMHESRTERPEVKGLPKASMEKVTSQEQDEMKRVKLKEVSSNRPRDEMVQKGEMPVKERGEAKKLDEELSTTLMKLSDVPITRYKGPVTAKVNLQLESTYQTGLCHWEHTTIAVMPQSNELVMWGKSSDEMLPALHIYSRVNDQWHERKSIQPTCKHDEYYLLFPSVPENKLAISCWNCEEIQCIDLTSDATDVILKKRGVYPSLIIQGDPGFMFAVDTVVGGKQIIKIDCNSKSTDIKTIKTNMMEYYSICYVPTEELIAISNWKLDPIVYAVRSDTGDKVWETRWDKTGDEPFYPHGLTYSAKHNLLFVAGGKNGGIAVLKPGDGSILQTLQLDLGILIEMYICDRHLVLWHRLYKDEREQISYISID